MSRDAHMYKILFFVQSTVFIIVLMAFIQNSDVVPKVGDRKKSCRHSDYSESIIRAYRQEAATAWLRFAHQLRNATGRGLLSGCTLGDILLSRPGVVMITTTNTGFMDMTLNMLKSIRQCGLCINTTVVAEDQNCFDYLSKLAAGDPAVHVVFTNTGQTRSEEIGRGNLSEYYAFFSKRQAYILALLERGYDVLLSDADTFWFQDPFPYFEGSYDMSMMDPRSPYPLRTPQSHYCAGFVYFKPTDVTIQFVKTWIQTMRHNDKIGRVSPDQNVMNDLLKADKPVHVHVQPLNYLIFPWGPKFYELRDKDPNYKAVVMHAASIRGKAAKINKFKSSNMWLMNSAIQDKFDDD